MGVIAIEDPARLGELLCFIIHSLLFGAVGSVVPRSSRNQSAAGTQIVGQTESVAGVASKEDCGRTNSRARRAGSDLCRERCCKVRADLRIQSITNLGWLLAEHWRRDISNTARDRVPPHFGHCTGQGQDLDRHARCLSWRSSRARRRCMCKDPSRQTQLSGFFKFAPRKKKVPW